MSKKVEYQPNRLQVWDNEELEYTQTKKIKRLSLRLLTGEVGKVMNFDRGFFYMVKELSIRPGKIIRSYLDTGRYKVTNPLRYFLVIVGITLLLAKWTGYYEVEQANTKVNIKEKTETMSESKSEEYRDRTSDLKEAMSRYYYGYQNIWSILSIFFTSVFSFLFFRKSGFNFTEHMVINLYTFTHAYFLFFILVVFGWHGSTLRLVITGVSMVYMCFAYYQLFGKGKFATIIRTLLIAIISSILYFAAMATLLLIYLLV